MLAIAHSLSHRENTWDYIRHSVVYELQKTRQWSPTPISQSPLVQRITDPYY